MRPLAFAVTVLSLSLPVMAAGMSTVDGTWHVTGDVQGNPVDTMCVLAQKEGKITGTCTGVDGKPVPVTGAVKEKSFKWQYDSAYQGSGITLFYTGSFDKEDHLTGGVFVEPYAVDGAFTATRDKPAAPPAA